LTKNQIFHHYHISSVRELTIDIIGHQMMKAEYLQQELLGAQEVRVILYHYGDGGTANDPTKIKFRLTLASGEDEFFADCSLDKATYSYTDGAYIRILPLFVLWSVKISPSNHDSQIHTLYVSLYITMPIALYLKIV